MRARLLAIVGPAVPQAATVDAGQVAADRALLFATLVPDLPFVTAAILSARLHQEGYRVVGPDIAEAGVSC